MPEMNTDIFIRLFSQGSRVNKLYQLSNVLCQNPKSFTSSIRCYKVTIWNISPDTETQDLIGRIHLVIAGKIFSFALPVKRPAGSLPTERLRFVV